MPTGHPKEKPVPRSMRIERRWDGTVFSYWRVYSDGAAEAVNRREADKWQQAYGAKVETVSTTKGR